MSDPTTVDEIATLLKNQLDERAKNVAREIFNLAKTNPAILKNFIAKQEAIAQEQNKKNQQLVHSPLNPVFQSKIVQNLLGLMLAEKQKLETNKNHKPRNISDEELEKFDEEEEEINKSNEMQEPSERPNDEPTFMDTLKDLQTMTEAEKLTANPLAEKLAEKLGSALGQNSTFPQNRPTPPNPLDNIVNGTEVKEIELIVYNEIHVPQEMKDKAVQQLIAPTDQMKQSQQEDNAKSDRSKYMDPSYAMKHLDPYNTK